ncbi:unnamed protein product [Brassicogethes aeneus]|uniref:Sulfotransferase domain-containing protein n=1 Tax=Brassicogethes aeneus TaxID=1431903 RepID=A0A9P0FJU4_BRAAE|nr:unnamed protein product [Brassicogethes aeneus]
MDKCTLKRKNPNTIQKLSKESIKIIQESGIADYIEIDKLVHIGPKKYVNGNFYEKYKDEIYNFTINENDVWIITTGRSGTTVTQEMVWQICNDMDFEGGFKTPLIERFPYFEYALMFGHRKELLLKKSSNDPKECASIETIFTPEWEKPKVSNQRFYKSHLPISLLPMELTQKAKIVYMARNPKDMAISFYHFLKQYGKEPPNFENYWNLWETGLMIGHPYLEHVLEAWNLRNQDNVLFLFYEDFVKDNRAVILKLCKFFGKTYSDAQIDKLVDHLKIDNFRNNSSVNRDYFDYYPPKVENFVRRGKVDSHKDEVFTNELSKKADKWIQEQYKKTDMRFPNIPY